MADSTIQTKEFVTYQSPLESFEVANERFLGILQPGLIRGFSVWQPIDGTHFRIWGHNSGPRPGIQKTTKAGALSNYRTSVVYTKQGTILHFENNSTDQFGPIQIIPGVASSDSKMYYAVAIKHQYNASSPGISPAMVEVSNPQSSESAADSDVLNTYPELKVIIGHLIFDPEGVLSSTDLQTSQTLYSWVPKYSGNIGGENDLTRDDFENDQTLVKTSGDQVINGKKYFSHPMTANGIWIPNLRNSVRFKQPTTFDATNNRWGVLSFTLSGWNPPFDCKYIIHLWHNDPRVISGYPIKYAKYLLGFSKQTNNSNGVISISLLESTFGYAEALDAIKVIYTVGQGGNPELYQVAFKLDYVSQIREALCIVDCCIRNYDANYQDQVTLLQNDSTIDISGLPAGQGEDPSTWSGNRMNLSIYSCLDYSVRTPVITLNSVNAVTYGLVFEPTQLQNGQMISYKIDMMLYDGAPKDRSNGEHWPISSAILHVENRSGVLCTSVVGTLGVSGSPIYIRYYETDSKLLFALTSNTTDNSNSYYVTVSILDKTPSLQIPFQFVKTELKSTITSIYTYNYKIAH